MGNEMTYAEFKELLTKTQLFTKAQVHAISRHVRKYTIGNAIIACKHLDIELSIEDIDEIVNCHLREYYRHYIRNCRVVNFD